MIESYIHSLLIYFGTPLIAAGLISEKQIESWEREHLRLIHLLPCDLKR